MLVMRRIIFMLILLMKTKLKISMYFKKKIICIITARSGSKGLRNKNLLKLGNISLVSWPLSAAKNSKFIDEIYLSTDSKIIMNEAKKLNIKTRKLRPKFLSKNKSKSIDVILNVLSLLEKRKEYYDYVLLLEPTSPFTDAKDIDDSIKKLFNNRYAESLVSIKENITHHPIFNFKINKNNLIQSYKKNYITTRRQDLDKLYFLDGSIYFSKVSSLKKNKNFCHSKTTFITLANYKSLEIDDYMDLLYARTIYKNLKNINNNEK